MSKAKTSFKGILFLFLIIATIAGIVCAVIFIPKKPEKVKYALNDQSQIVLSEDGDFIKNLNAYKTSATDYFDANPNLKSIFNVFSGLSKYMSYTAYVFDTADFIDYEKSDINIAYNKLNSAKITATNVSQYLKDKNVSLTQKVGDEYIYGNAEASLVFENISVDLENIFKYYATAMESISKLYKQNVTKGVYANDFACTAIESAGYYMNFLYKNFDKIGEIDYKFMAVNFEKLSNNYFGNTNLILNYNTTTSLIEKVGQIKKISDKIENVTLKTIIDQKLNLDTSELTSEQIEVVNLSTTFLKGEIAV